MKFIFKMFFIIMLIAAKKLYKKAAKNIQDLAKNGNTYAQDFFATMLANGRGIAKDEKEAIKWYRKAPNKISHLQNII